MALPFRCVFVCACVYLPEILVLAAESDAVTNQGAVDVEVRRKLPHWLRFSAELQGRSDLNLDRGNQVDDRLYLNRIRLNATVQPAGWMRFELQGQDARGFRLSRDSTPGCGRNAADLRLGFIELGNRETGWQARAGRQELSFGDERLLGADNYWDLFGQSFDAVRLSYSGSGFRIDAVTGFRVEPGRRRPDPLDTASRISGLSIQFKTGNGIVEPYFLWKRGNDTFDLTQHSGHRDVVTPGLRLAGDLPRAMDYNVEMALQRGHVVSEPMSTWGGHWEVGWRPLGEDIGPRIGVEYNFASGDGDKEDHRHNTFDDMYPAGFNKYGIVDPFAWRNIKYPALSVDIPVTRRWTLYTGHRAYWLAQIRDGLYTGGDEFLIRNQDAKSSFVGAQILVSAGYTHSTRWRLNVGYGHMLAGGYLRGSGYHSGSRSIYLLFNLVL